MKIILFICIENSCRSQMAEAFAKMHGKGILLAYSAGSNALGKVNAKAIKSMKKIGYDLSTHRSKPLSQIPDIEYDHIISMGCGDKCPFVKTKNRTEWEIPDPKNMNECDFNKVRDTIEKEVKSLLGEIKYNS